jgi:urease accessory protein
MIIMVRTMIISISTITTTTSTVSMTITADGVTSEPAERANLSDEGVLKLGVWLSPAFPVGGFTYSHGLEWAIEDGSVTSAVTLAAWLDDILDHGAGRNDAILFCAAWRAASGGDIDRLAEVIELSDAFQPSRERRLEASAQGAAFAKAVGDSWMNEALAERLCDLGAVFVDRPIPWTYATAVAVAASAHGLALRPVLKAYLQAFAANAVSAGVRAIPLGQTQGLGILARLAPRFFQIAEHAISATLEDLGGAALRADIASMRHETQYTRLFRS